MDEAPYEYCGLIAASWDLLRGDTSGWSDRPFYRAIIAATGQPVLDVGCGTGRLLLDYLAAGIDIDGVDNSPEMLVRCRARALGLVPALYEQPMEALALPRRYRTILVPSSSFQLLTEPAAAAAALRRFYAHLEPGGTLVMSFMVLWTAEVAARTVEIRPGVFAAPDWYRLVEQVRRWVRATYDVPQQLEHTEDRYELLRDGTIVATEHHRRSPATRWYSQAEALQLYADAGFVDLRCTRDFTPDLAGPADTVFCVHGTCPSGPDRR